MSENKAKTLEEARALGDTLHTLRVDDKWTTPWQHVISEFTQLHRLYLTSGVDSDPQKAKSLPATIKELEIVLQEPKAQLPAWIAALPQLEVLELWGRHLKEGELPMEIGQLKKLRELELVSCGLRDLPPSLEACDELKVLKLRGLPMDSFPSVICKLTSLEELHFRQPVKDLPAELADLTKLKVLDLGSALNKGTMNAADQPDHYFQPMPAVIRELPALETLNLAMCGIFERDIATLAGHPTLRSLDIQYAGIEDLSGMRELPALRELLMETCYKARDLRPLAGTAIERLSVRSNHYLRDISPILEMPALKWLNIESCSDIGLGPVFEHPTLETLVADDDVVERWKRRGALKGVTRESLLAGMESDDAQELERTLELFAAWVEQNANSDHNPCYELFDVEQDEEGLTEVPLLSEVVRNPALSAATIASVVKATFRSMEDSLAPTVHAVQVLIERGDVEAQKLVVQAFVDAGEYYDGGHRMWEETVHDTFIEELFPAFHCDALAELLPKLDGDMLNSDGGDAMDALFVPAFDGASEETTARLSDCLREYLDEHKDYRPAEYWTKLFGQIGAVNPAAMATLEASLGEIKVLADWTKKLEGADEADDASAAAMKALEGLVAAVSSGELTTAQISALDRPIKRCIDSAKDMPAKLAQALLDLSFEVNESWWRTQSMMRPLVMHDLAGLQDEENAKKKAKIAEAIESCLKQAKAPEERDLFLAAYASLSGKDADEIERELAAKALTQAIDRANADKLEGALDQYLSQPSPLEIKAMANGMLAMALEQIFYTEDWEQMGRVADKFRQARAHLSWKTEHQQYCLSYPVAAAIKAGPEFYRAHVAPWLEGEELIEPRFAYNLACYFAQRGSDEELFATVARAIELGKPKAQFLNDEDFEKHLEKPEMKKLLQD